MTASHNMKSWLFSTSVLLGFLLCDTAEARMAIDLSKTTCHRAFFIGRIAAPANSIALWLSGYFDGQHGHGVVDVETLEQNANKVRRYCRFHRDETLIKAMEAALGTDK
jgi:HdeA/HdeB family